MTIKNFFIDLWLSIRYGDWRVIRQRKYGDRGVTGLGWYWQYAAEHKRSGDRIFCVSRRIAEGVCATEMDLRGTRHMPDDLRGSLSDYLNTP